MTACSPHFSEKFRASATSLPCCSRRRRPALLSRLPRSRSFCGRSCPPAPAESSSRPVIGVGSSRRLKACSQTSAWRRSPPILRMEAALLPQQPVEPGSPISVFTAGRASTIPTMMPPRSKGSRPTGPRRSGLVHLRQHRRRSCARQCARYAGAARQRAGWRRATGLDQSLNSCGIPLPGGYPPGLS